MMLICAAVHCHETCKRLFKKLPYSLDLDMEKLHQIKAASSDEQALSWSAGAGPLKTHVETLVTH